MRDTRGREDTGRGGRIARAGVALACLALAWPAPHAAQVPVRDAPAGAVRDASPRAPQDRAPLARDTASRRREVLFLDPDDPMRPAFRQLVDAFQDRVAADTSLAVTLDIEAADLGRFGSPGYERDYRTWLATKYRARHLDAIVTLTGAGLRLADSLRLALGRPIPLVAIADTVGWLRTAPAAPATRIPLDVDVAGTVQLVRALVPGLRTVAYFGGEDFGARLVARAVRAALPRDVRFVEIEGPTAAAMLDAVARLPREETALVYGGMTRDRAGTTYLARELVRPVAARSPVPTFALMGNFLGEGIVGGSLLDFGVLGATAGDRVLAVLRGDPLPPGGREPVATRRVVDVRALDRFGIPRARVPAGTELAWRERSLWERYPLRVVAVVVLFLVQSALIAALLQQRRRRAQAQDALRRLNVRLMSAQETERARIARELHDGVNQQLALVAIGLDGVRARAGGPGRDATLDDLAQQVQGLAADVRRIAGDLHPARLERLGFHGAVRAMVHEFRTRHRILATGRIAPDFPATLPADVSLALYRTVQEALQNVARHSGARHASIVAERRAGMLRVVVEDDGTGLDDSRGAGLGLVGIAERAAALDGSCRVESVVPHGLRLVVEVPWTPDPPRGGRRTPARTDRVTRTPPATYAPPA